MIVVVEEESNSGERSPLKSGPNPNQAVVVGSPSQPAPPPPYVAAAAAHHQSYQSVSPGGLPPPVTFLVLERETPLRRFLKAFGVALIIIFLWSVFIDSVDMAVGGRHKGGRKYDAEGDHDGFEWIIRDWYKGTPSAPCSCSQSSAPTTTTAGARILPIEYPPAATSPQVGIALPTLSSSLPCATGVSTSLPEQS